jgi:class 3 adenylate cyclase/tetratricopeptide (TPR) repeat protein
VLRCASCGFTNAAGLKFCGDCGARLAQSTPAGGRERKVVSVLFCDLVAFTAASDGADPEDVQAALSPYHARARTEIERFGGTVEKFIGDAVMAAFGAPVVHEDDPERAVRAGLALLAAVAELNIEHGLDLSVRIGVATGEAVVSTGASPERGEGMLAGDVVNTAARLQASAPVGAVVVGEGTWRATRAVFDFQPLDAVWVKGKASALSIWAVLGARARVGEALASTATAMVGRQDELEMLQRTYTRSLREASVQLVTVVAEPGVGKSRLVQEFADWIDRREELVTWRLGRCLPYGDGITFWALGQIVKAHAGILDTDSSEEVSAKLTDAVRALHLDPAQVGWMVSRLRPLVGLGGGESAREELFTAWQRFFEEVASTGPLVIVIEDLHWADEALLAFCEHLLQWVVGVRLVLIATARPELFDKAPTWGAGHRNATTIGLPPLSDVETAQLIAGLLGTAVLPASTHAFLLQRSGGNALYAEEFIRMLADRQALPVPVDPGGGSELDEVFPDSVQAIIAARLDTLTAESKTLLLDAAVVGQTFWSGAVAALGGRDEPAVRASLHELSRRDYLRPARLSTLAGQGEYIFGHALIAEVAYSQIPRASRAEKHSTVARWLTGLAGDTAGDQAAVIAHHYHQAHTLTAAAGTGTVDDVRLAELADQARSWHTLAAEHDAVLDPVAADRHYRAALDLTPVDHPRHPGLLMAYAAVLASADRLSAAEDAYQRAEDEYLRHGLLVDAAVAAIRRSTIISQADRGAEASRCLDQVISVLEGRPPGPALVEAYVHRAGEHMRCGRMQQAVDWANTALRMADDLGLPRGFGPRSTCLKVRGVGRCTLGDTDGDRDIESALRLAEEHNLTDATMSLYINFGIVKLIAESPVAALAVYDQGLAVGRDRGRPGWVRWLEGCQAEALAMLGRLDDALALCESGRTIPTGHDEPGSALDHRATQADVRPDKEDIGLRVVLADLLTIRGDFDRAVSLLSSSLSDARGTGSPGILIPTLAAALRCAPEPSQTSQARSLVEELIAVLEPEADAESCQYLAELARILAPAGHSDIVNRIIAAAPSGPALFDNNVLTARAVLDETAGNDDEAADRYQQAAGSWQSYGYPLEQAQALLGLARCRRQPHQLAEDSIRQALDILTRLGAEPLIAQAEQQLQRLQDVHR